jgi:hypothetical protein
MVNIIRNQGTVKVIQQNNNTQHEDNFVLQTPIKETLAVPVTKFVFEGDIDSSIESQSYNNISQKSNTNINANDRYDDFVLAKPGNEQLVDGVTKKTMNSQEPHKINRFDNPESIPSIVDVTRSISKIANMIRESLKRNDVYGKITYDKMKESEFYYKLSNPIWKSLLQICNIEQLPGENQFNIPKVDMNTPYLETWRFFDRMYHDTRVSFDKDPIIAITNYKNIFQVNGGITSKLIPVLFSKIGEKLNGISPSDLNIIVNNIGGVWCYRDPSYIESIGVDSPMPPRMTLFDPFAHNDTDEEFSIGNEVQVHIPIAQMDKVNKNNNIYQTDDNDDYEDDCDDESDYDEDCDDYDDCCDEYEDEDHDDEVLTIDIQNDTDVNEAIISISAWNGTTTALYEVLEVKPETEESLDWSWLRHFIPNAVIVTEEPDAYLEYNEMLDCIRFAQLAKSKDVTEEPNDSATIIGLYYIDEEVENMEDNLLHTIGNIVEQNMSVAPNLSHLVRTLQMDRLIVDEISLLKCIGQIDDDDNGNYANPDADECEDEDEEYESTLAFAASLISGNNDMEAPTPTEIIEEDDYEDDNQEVMEEPDAEAEVNEEIYEVYEEEEEIVESDTSDNCENTIGDYIRNKYGDADGLVLQPIVKGRNSKYQDVE